MLLPHLRDVFTAPEVVLQDTTKGNAQKFVFLMKLDKRRRIVLVMGWISPAGEFNIDDVKDVAFLVEPVSAHPKARSQSQGRS